MTISGCVFNTVLFRIKKPTFWRKECGSGVIYMCIYMGGVIEVAADDPCISIGLTQRRIAEDPPLIEQSSLVAQGAIR